MKVSSKKYKKLKEYALKYVRTLSRSEKEYTNLNMETKIHSNEFLAKQYVNKYLNAYEENRDSFLKGFMRSRSKDIEQRIHLGNYYQYKGDLESKIKSEESFYEKYKDEIYINSSDKEYNGMSIEEILEEFKKDKTFTKERLNKILEEFKKQNEKYIKSGSS